MERSAPYRYKIESSRRHVISDVLNNYEKRFPGDDFIHGFKAPDGSSVGDLREIISTLEGRRKQHEHVFSTYGTRLFPLDGSPRFYEFPFKT